MKKSKQQERTEIKENREQYFEEKAKKAKKMFLDCLYHFIFFTTLAVIISNDSFLNILSKTIVDVAFWALIILSITSAVLTYRWYDGWLFQLKMKNVTSRVFEGLEKDLGKYDKN